MRRSARRAGATTALAALVFVAACEGEHRELPPPEVIVAPATKQDVPIYGEWVGSTVGLVNAQITPKVEGYLLEQAYKNGALVDAGQLLFRIDPRQFQAALDQAVGQLQRAQAALGKSQLDVKRYRPLAAEGAVSQQELDDAVQRNLANEADVRSAQAAVDNARLNLGWTEVRSPISGIAGINVAQIGDLVGTNTVLTTVSQVDPIKVEFPISEQEYLTFARARVRAGDSKEGGVPITLFLSDGSQYEHKGHTLDVNRQVEQETGTIRVQGLFPNPDRILRPGLFARIKAATHTLPNAVLIPQRAVLDMQGLHRVAIVDKDDTASLRAVTVGPKVGDNWVIEKGVQAGDRVVVEGLLKVKEGTKVVPKPVSATKQGASPGGDRSKPATPAAES